MGSQSEKGISSQMSPEEIERHMWSEKKDVWAWAVTLWEIFTHGKVPYTFIASDPGS